LSEQPVTHAQRLITVPKRVVSFFCFHSDGEDEYDLSRDGLIGYVNLERTQALWLATQRWRYRISIGTAVLHPHGRQSLYFTNGRQFPLSKLSLGVGDLDPI